MIFSDLCIFSLFVIYIINPLISEDGAFVYRRLISEMQHAPETRLPFSDDVVVAVLVVVVVASVADVAINKNRLNALTRLVPYIHISRI